MTADLKVPAGYCAAQWVGPYDALTPDREILDPDGEPTGEVILGAFLVAGETVHVVPQGEADQSAYWKPVQAKRRPKARSKSKQAKRRPKARSKSKQAKAARDAQKTAAADAPAKPAGTPPRPQPDPPLPPAPTASTPGTIVPSGGDG